MIPGIDRHSCMLQPDYNSLFMPVILLPSLEGSCIRTLTKKRSNVRLNGRSNIRLYFFLKKDIPLSHLSHLEALQFLGFVWAPVDSPQPYPRWARHARLLQQELLLLRRRDHYWNCGLFRLERFGSIVSNGFYVPKWSMIWSLSYGQRSTSTPFNRKRKHVIGNCPMKCQDFDCWAQWSGGVRPASPVGTRIRIRLSRRN